jgi:hypothetical protein
MSFFDVLKGHGFIGAAAGELLRSGDLNLRRSAASRPEAKHQAGVFNETVTEVIQSGEGALLPIHY